MTDTDRAALAARHVVKAYGGAVALEDTSLEVRAGEVHALLGQNGCGKSTLIKILTGVVTSDGGEVEIFGSPLDTSSVDHHDSRIAVVHQDVGVVDSMTVLENLGVNAGYGTSLLAPVNVKKERAVYNAILDRLGFDLDLDVKVASLSPTERALLAIARAMRLMDDSTENHLFILDEPTASLPKHEAADLLKLMRRMADLGAGVVFVSHRLGEVMEICDRATVMRKGRDVVTVEVAGTTRADLVAHMLGERMDNFFPDPPALKDTTVRLEVRDLVGSKVDGMSFSIRAGEIVGFTGLTGMGQEELPRLLVGDLPTNGGTVALDGDDITLDDPAKAIAAGVVLVPGNRLRDGVWIAGTAEENVTLPVVERGRTALGIDSRLLRTRAVALMERSQVHPAEPEYPVAAFSGGNQQKLVFMKWLQLEPRVLLLDEPTQGVDPGAAKVLLGEMTTAAKNGAAVAVFSGDHEQLVATCHRVLVLHQGRLVAELAGDSLNEAAVLEACDGKSLN